MRKYQKLPLKIQDKISMGAGIIASAFEPSAGTVEQANILFASTGGFNFRDTISYRDNGAEIDNCPDDTFQLKEIEKREIMLSGTAATAVNETIKSFMAAADISENKIIPRNLLKNEDFQDLWLIGDYGATDGGFMAIKLMHGLSNEGLSVQTVDKNTSKYNFSYKAHYDLESPDTVPYEVYIVSGPLPA